MLDANSKILVVDDFDTFRRQLRNVLNKLGIHEIVDAGNGGEALDLLKKHAETPRPFDIVFMDLSMPVMNGMELFQAAKANPKLNHIPFVMVTVETEASVVVEALDAGIVEYIQKPVSDATLTAKIKKLMKRQRKAA